MRKYPVACGVVGIVFITSLLLGQEPSITPKSALPTTSPIPTGPAPTIPEPTVPEPTPVNRKSDIATKASREAREPSAVEGSSTFQWSEVGAPTFTIDQAVLTALQRNATILTALEEIKRSKGVIIEIRAQALPHITPNGTYEWVDPNLGGRAFSSGGGPSPTPGASGRISGSDVSYNIRVTGSQLIFNGTTWPAIRGTFFQRDSAYFALRNTVDQVISTVKQQFYQVLLNRELIVVQEDSVRLLENQLKDQENRYEAGTVPRFNVLQAQVALANQIPLLITARNNYRISILTLAKTLGLDFNPARGVAAPLRVVGKLTYIPRRFDLLQAIEAGKQNRPFLKQARANVLNQIEQVHVALGGFFPTINATGGGEWLSSPVNSSFGDISKGWIAQGTASWPIWDSGQVYGQWKQQRALLSEAKITYDDDVRQVELEIQTAASNVLQNRELIQATEKTVEEAAEAVRLAQARLDAGAGVQLDVLNAQVQLTTAQSNRLQALFGYISSVAEFDRVTGTQSKYTETFNGIAPHATRTRTYYTGSDVDATGKPKRRTELETVTVKSGKPSSK
jgi:outer membrane protein TolC